MGVSLKTGLSIGQHLITEVNGNYLPRPLTDKFEGQRKGSRAQVEYRALIVIKLSGGPLPPEMVYAKAGNSVDKVIASDYCRKLFFDETLFVFSFG